MIYFEQDVQANKQQKHNSIPLNIREENIQNEK